MQIDCSIDIRSTPKEVFGWLEAPEKAMVWMTSVSRTEILLDTPERVGTMFREVLEENGQTLEMQGAITGYQPDQSISFHLESSVNALDVQYSVVEIPEGVRVLECAKVRWKFPLNVYGIFFEQKMRQGILVQLQTEFARLKEICESAG